MNINPEDPPAQMARPQRWSFVGFFALLSVAIFLRVWKLGTIPGCNGDEAWYGTNALLLLHRRPYPNFTPNGNPLNWYYFGPVLLLHSFFSPSLTLLRIAAVLAGFAALIVNYLLCVRVYGKTTASVSTLLLAVLPTTITESRLGWDPSESVLATLVVLYLAVLSRMQVRRAKVWLCLSYAAVGIACQIHPTNVFIAVMPLAATGALFWPSIRRWSKMAQWISLGIAVDFALSCYAIISRHSALLPGAIDWRRLLSPHGELTFVQYCLREYSGVLNFQFIAGSCRTPELCDLVTAAILVFCMGTVLKHGPGRMVVVGLIGGFLLFDIITPVSFMSPSHSRYILWMIAPGVLTVAQVITRGLQGRVFWRVSALISLGLACVLMLVSVYLNYFQVLSRTGGLGPRVFRTAERDPKEEALRYIITQRTGPQKIVIATNEWWTYKPIEYLAFNDPTIQVCCIDTSENANPALVKQFVTGHFWFVEFCESEPLQELHRILKQSKIAYRERIIRDNSGRPIIAVIRRQ